MLFLLNEFTFLKKKHLKYWGGVTQKNDSICWNKYLHDDVGWFFLLSHITNKCVSCLNLNLTYSPAHDQNIWIQTSDKPLFNLEDLLGLHLKAPRIYTFMQRGAHLQSCMWHAGSRSSTLKEFGAGDARQETRRIKQIKKRRRRKRRKTFQCKTPQNKKNTRRALTLAPYCTRPICFVPSYLPLPSEGEPLGAILGPSSLPWPPFSPQPLKSCTAMCMALMFALYPTCKAIIIHASWQSQALSLLHLQLFALGYDMTVRLISSLLHIAPCVSLFLSVLPLLRMCTMFDSDSDLTTWKIFYLSACVTPQLLWSLPQFPR